MDLVVPDPSFVRQKLTVQTAGFLSGAKVLLNGIPVKPSKREYVVQDDQGSSVSIRLKGNLADPIPLVMLNGRQIRLARALTWYEYAWIGVPGSSGIFRGRAWSRDRRLRNIHQQSHSQKQ